MNYEYCDGMTHTIKKGDTLYEISRAHNVPLSLLLRANPYVDVFNLQIGDTLCIPTRRPVERSYPMPELSPGPVRPRGSMGMPNDTESGRGVTDPFDNTEPFDDAVSEGERVPQMETPQTTMPQTTTPQMAAPQMTTQPQSDMQNRRNNPQRVNVPPRIDPQTERVIESQDIDKVSVKAESGNTKAVLENDQTVSKESMDEKTLEANEKRWKKYVVKPGDTLGDLLKGTDTDVEDFVKKNGITTIYMLPGVAYYIPMK